MDGGKILIVDDDPFVRMLLKDCLSTASFEVEEATGGIRGLILAEELAPDLVMLDVRMPDLNGIEVLRRLRACEKTKHLPVILLTGDTLDIDNAVSAFDLEPSDVMTKSISTKEMLARIRWVLRREAFVSKQPKQV